jgi:hypothetical protein
MPTAVSGPALKKMFADNDQLAFVWPLAEGSVHGIGFTPLYPSVPRACLIDEDLYEVVSLVDAIRGGAAREREIAKELLNKRLA